MLTPLQRIHALETERQQLLAAGDDWSFADRNRIGRIRNIEAELQQLWHEERQLRADRKQSHGRRLRSMLDI